MRQCYASSAGLICALALALGCSSSHHSSPAPVSASFAGEVSNGTTHSACVWTGTTRTDLAVSSDNSCASSPVVVADGTLYVAGSYYSGTRNVPCTWAGTTRTDLPGGVNATDNASAYAIAVVGGTVYAAGCYEDSTVTPTVTVPCYWNGATKVPLPCATVYGVALGIAVSGGTVHTVGYCYGTTDVACLWIGTTRTDLAGVGVPDSDATCIAFSGTTPIIGGDAYDGTNWLPCYWTGTTPQPNTLPALSGDWAEVNAIAVDGGTIYAGGDTYDGSKSVPCYWTGGIRTDLAGDGTHDAYVLAIDTASGTIICGGLWSDGSQDHPCFWTGTDASATNLPVIGTNEGEVLNGWWLTD